MFRNGALLLLTLMAVMTNGSVEVITLASIHDVYQTYISPSKPDLSVGHWIKSGQNHTMVIILSTFGFTSSHFLLTLMIWTFTALSLMAVVYADLCVGYWTNSCYIAFSTFYHTTRWHNKPKGVEAPNDVSLKQNNMEF